MSGGVAGFAVSDMLEQASEGADRSEFFEYRVSTPLDLSRGGSAMVEMMPCLRPFQRVGWLALSLGSRSGR